jgi:hypothetical protein
VIRNLAVDFVNARWGEIDGPGLHHPMQCGSLTLLALMTLAKTTTESEANMPQMQSKNLSKPDELRTFDKGKVELATLGGVTFGRATLLPGWKWSTCVKPIVKTKSCEPPHLHAH